MNAKAETNYQAILSEDLSAENAEEIKGGGEFQPNSQLVIRNSTVTGNR